jgi:hypothetical protein
MAKKALKTPNNIMEYEDPYKSSTLYVNMMAL